MKLSDHIKMKVTLEGESTGDIEVDKLMKEMADDMFEKLKSANRITGDESDEALAKFFCESFCKAIVDMSDEAFNNLLIKFVEEFGK